MPVSSGSRRAAFAIAALIACVVAGGWLAHRQLRQVDRESEETLSGRRAARMLFEASRDIVFLDHGGVFDGRSWRDELRGAADITWADLHRALGRCFERQRIPLERDWGLTGKLLRAAFLTAAVSHLFGAGDADEQGGKVPASVRRYHAAKARRAGLETPPAILPVDAYLESPAGECNDYAMVLYMMLRLSGYEARQVGTPGHIYVEARIDGRAFILDAMYAFFTEQTAEGFLQQDPSRDVEYHLLPFDGDDPASPRFRRWRGMRRMYYLLTRGRVDPRPPKDYAHWNRFETWMRIHGIHISGKDVE